MTVYRVKNWDQNFENNRTREMKRMGWTPIPNKFDSDGYLTLMDHERGPAHYAAWVTLVGIAGKCERRGTLLRDGQRPHDAVSLARITRIPAEIFREALPRLVHEVGWLEVVPDEDDLPQEVTDECQSAADELDSPPQSPATEDEGPPQEGVTERKGRERKGIEWNGTEQNRTELKVGGEVLNNSPREMQPKPVRPASPPAPSRVKDLAKEAVEVWESHPELLQTHRTDPTFGKLLQGRFKDPYFRKHWREGIAIVARSKLCRGEVPPREGFTDPWRASFRWFCDPTRLVEILAGKHGGSRDGPEDWLDDVPVPPVCPP